jgi:YfiH family protein
MNPVAEFAPSLTLDGVVHGFFGRQGGASGGDFASLNCSFQQGDVAALVAANREAVLSSLGVKQVAIARQVHSAEAVEVTAPFAEDARPEVDALVTRVPGLGLGVLTADCVPVLMVDRLASVIGAAHAGWRGAVGGIIASTVAKMRELGADAAHIRAAIGPAISADNYEVGEDFVEELLHADRRHSSYLSATLLGKPHFDLTRFVLDRLAEEGIEAERIGGCTYANEDRYFSHRRATHQGIKAGRQLSVIALRA